MRFGLFRGSSFGALDFFIPIKIMTITTRTRMTTATMKLTHYDNNLLITIIVAVVVVLLMLLLLYYL